MCCGICFSAKGSAHFARGGSVGVKAARIQVEAARTTVGNVVIWLEAARRTPKVVLIWYEVFRIYVVAEDKYIKIMHLG